MDGRFSFIFLSLPPTSPPYPSPSPPPPLRRRSRRRKYLSRGSSDRVRKKRRRKERNGVQPECASEEITLGARNVVHQNPYVPSSLPPPLSLSLSLSLSLPSWHGSNRGQHGGPHACHVSDLVVAQGERNSQSRIAFFKRRIPARVTKSTELLPSPLFSSDPSRAR